ncbi:serine/threonine protein kinase [Streptomyces sp. BH-SS-21]|uniref:non-specific serine/threonine protein kinase n=1 Tax=Streptomyces liliiviolaceus TaxID=2823109 RepID=A0A940XN57_9ACTN|nr:serine/threonine-protein kinase [Streptomyces liliiviolaceus]MBQ0847010.1 serine/threonine protein kinase [Streptomyces liliiviolaceus]
MATEGERPEDNARVIAGRYRLEARIGRGGMGVVWRATDQLLARQVAVKELAVDTSLSVAEARLQRERTLREARAIAQLRHPHIIVVHDVVEQDERPYIVMDLLEGGSLAERISRSGPIGPVEAARMGIDLLGALRKAHDAGVLHRDLKPANVLLTLSGIVVLTDFGVAQVAGSTTLTESGSFVGSPEYTAPERMAGLRTGPESDLWSLGALLCTVLSGESPFRRDSLGGTLHAVVVDDILPPAAAGPLLPVVRGLLERDPERRLDAVEAERLLRVFLDTGRMPQAQPGRTPSRRGAPGRDHGTSASASASAVPEPTVPHPLRAPFAVSSSMRNVLIAAALVAAMAVAGVSAAALLLGDGGNGPTPPGGSVSSSRTATGPTPSDSATGPRPTASASRTVPTGYRLVRDAAGFSLAVPVGFTREAQGERVYYMSAGKTFRIGVKVSAPEPGGPLAVMERAAEKGTDTYPGYRDGRVTETTRSGRPAALWEFTWDGFSAAEGARHIYELCWEEDGRMYDVLVSSPVGKAREAREYFDVAVDTVARTGS